jgi:DNA-binding NtrC family response regulator
MSFRITCRELFRCFLGRGRRSPRSAPAPRRPEVLAISPDTRFFSSLLQATAPYNWTVRWARSINAAMDILATRTIAVIIYDCYSPADDWSGSIARLKLTPEDPCIVLAARHVNEELWRLATGNNVYDLVCRTGHYEHLIATLQFALKWRADGGKQARRGASRSVSYRQRELSADRVRPPAGRNAG